MTKSQNIIGLAVISINDGRELGKVRDLIINPYKGEVEYLVVENDAWYLGAQVIPFKYLMGVGEYAVTIESQDVITSLREQSEVAALMNMQVRVKGTKVLTKKGRFIGQVDEFYVDVDSGKIICCELTLAQDNATKYIPVKGIVTFGRDILVVSDDVDELLVDSMEKLVKDDSNAFAQKTPPEIKTQPVQSFDEAPVIADTLPKVPKGRNTAPTPMADEAEEKSEPVMPPVSETVEEPQEEKAADEQEEHLIGELQNKYYIGKKISKRIEAPSGEVLADEGEEITEVLLKKVKEAGKYLELIMNVKE